MPPLVSIIIPCYNGSCYIPGLVASLKPLLAKQPGHYEIIFVDDGSKDNSGELFKSLMPDAVCIRQANAGPGATRNRGVSVAQGQFLQLLDADDIIEPDKLAAQTQAAADQQLDVVYSDWRMVVVDGQSVRLEPWVEARAQTDIIEALLGEWWFPTGAALIRRTAYLSLGGCDPRLRNTCDDFDLWIRLAIAGFKYGYVPGRFTNYYRYEQVRSVSRANRRDFFEGEAGIILNAIQLLAAQNELAPARRRAAARRLHAVARNAYLLDHQWYRRLLQNIHELDPAFHPKGPLFYRLAARAFGFEAAELMAVWKRKALSPGSWLGNKKSINT